MATKKDPVCSYCGDNHVETSQLSNGKYHAFCWHCLNGGPEADTREEARELFRNPPFFCGKPNPTYGKIPTRIRLACFFRAWWEATINPVALFMYAGICLFWGLPQFLSDKPFSSIFFFAIWFVFGFSQLIFVSALFSGMCDEGLSNNWQKLTRQKGNN